MSFWYNAPKEGEKFASLGCSKYDELNAHADFEELVIKENDDFYQLFGYFTKFSDILKSGEPKFKFEPQLVTFKILKKDGAKKQQSQVEECFCKILADIDKSKAYKGSLWMADSPQLVMLLTGKSGNDEVPEVVIKSFKDSLFKINNEVDLTKFTFDDAKLDESKFGGGKGYSSAQTEYQKLKDREKYFLETFNSVSGLQIENLKSLAELEIDFDWDAPKLISHVIKLTAHIIK